MASLATRVRYMRKAIKREVRFVLVLVAVIVASYIAGVIVGRMLSREHCAWFFVAPPSALVILGAWHLIKYAGGLPPKRSLSPDECLLDTVEARHARRALCVWLLGILTMCVGTGLQMLLWVYWK